MPTVRVPVIKDENSYYPFFRSTDQFHSTGGLIIDLDVTSSVFGVETIPAIPPVGEGWPGIKPTVAALKVIDPQGFPKWLNITPAAYAALIDAAGGIGQNSAVITFTTVGSEASQVINHGQAFTPVAINVTATNLASANALASGYFIDTITSTSFTLHALAGFAATTTYTYQFQFGE